MHTWDKNTANLKTYIIDSFSTDQENHQTFTSIKPKLNSFDLVGFGTFMIWGGKTITGLVKSRVGEICHVGVVIKGKDLPKTHVNYDENKVYILESNTSGQFGDGILDENSQVCAPVCCHIFCGIVMGPSCCVFDENRGFVGVMLRDLDKVVEAAFEGFSDRFPGAPCEPRFFWAPLKHEVLEESPISLNSINPEIKSLPKTPKIITSELDNLKLPLLEPEPVTKIELAKIVDGLLGVPYDYGCFGLCVASAMPTICCCCSSRPCRGIFYEKTTAAASDALFCSELVVVIYQKLKLLPQIGINAENAVPMDFFGEDVDNEIDFSKLFGDCVSFVA